MYPLLETIRYEAKAYRNLTLHETRMRRSRSTLFGIDDPVDLDLLLAHLPTNAGEGRYKCRILYGESVGPIELTSYTARRIGSLRVVAADGIDYALKYSDRGDLEAAGRLRGDCDEVVLSIGGLLTDTTYSNIALYDGSNWITPEPPLLPGTKREELIGAGILDPLPVRVEDLKYYRLISLVNAMLDLGEVTVPVDCVQMI